MRIVVFITDHSVSTPILLAPIATVTPQHKLESLRIFGMIGYWREEYEWIAGNSF